MDPPDANLEAMKRRAAEILTADPEVVSWFRYGASFVMSLLAAVDFYTSLNRDDEADDILRDLKGRTAAAYDTDTIARNLLRLGVYWDEASLLEAARSAAENIPLPDLLDIVRRK